NLKNMLGQIQPDRRNLTHGWIPLHGVFHQPPFWHLDAARGPSTPSLNDLVGARKDLGRHGEAEFFGGLQVDDQLEDCGLLDRKIGWLGALKRPARPSWRLPSAATRERLISRPFPAFDVIRASIGMPGARPKRSCCCLPRGERLEDIIPSSGRRRPRCSFTFP